MVSMQVYSVDSSYVSLTPDTPDWLPNMLKPTQRASMCSPSSQLTSKTRGRTPTRVRESVSKNASMLIFIN